MAVIGSVAGAAINPIGAAGADYGLANGIGKVRAVGRRPRASGDGMAARTAASFRRRHRPPRRRRCGVRSAGL